MEEYSEPLSMTDWTIDELKIIKDALGFSKEKMKDFISLNSNSLNELIPSDFSGEIRNKIRWRIDKVDIMIDKITEIIKSAEKRKASQTYNLEDFQAFQKFGI